MTIDAAEAAANEIYLHLWLPGDQDDYSKFERAQAELAERDQLPAADIASTGLCREASMFAIAMLEKAGWTGWEMVNGKFDLRDLGIIPLDIHDHHVHGDTEAYHTWILHEADGILMDLTAEQFGPDACAEGEPLVVPLDRAGHWRRDGRYEDWHSDPDVTGTVDGWLGLAPCDDATHAVEITDPEILSLADRLSTIHQQILPTMSMAG